MIQIATYKQLANYTLQHSYTTCMHIHYSQISKDHHACMCVFYMHSVQCYLNKGVNSRRGRRL